MSQVIELSQDKRGGVGTKTLDRSNEFVIVTQVIMLSKESLNLSLEL